MKKNRTATKALLGAGKRAQLRHKMRFDQPNVPLFPETTNRGLIQWPTEKQLMDVSKQLVQIGRMGLRSEASGDYFNSGDLAYQMQEIIRATTELFQKCRRIRR